MKQILSILIASLILFMNAGLTLISHYCNGELADVSFMFVQEDVSCGMADDESYCDTHSDHNSIDKDHGCENEFLQLKFDEDFEKSVIDYTSIDFNFAVALVNSYVNLYFINSSKNPEFLAYSPPLLDYDAQVMNQTFLI